MKVFSQISNLFNREPVSKTHSGGLSGVAEIDIGMHERMTPTELYDEFKKGERFENYTIDYGSDASYSVLSDVVKSYMKKPTKEGKMALFDQEEKILYEELEHPELTLARNYPEVEMLIDKNSSPEDVKARITLFNLAGLDMLLSNKRTSGRVNFDEEKIEFLKKIYKDTDENSDVGRDTKILASSIIYRMLLDVNVDKDKKQEISEFITANTSIQHIKEVFAFEKDCSDEIESLKENPEQYDKFREVLRLSTKENKKDVTDLVETVLADDNSSKEIKKLAVWGAGKYRSDKSFEIIKKIALDKDEEDITLREFAIQSSALYLRDKTDEVIEMMDTISNDGTIFEPLGKILKDKVTGNYHGQKDREFNYSSRSDGENKHLSKYVQNSIKFDEELNQQKENNLYRDLSYYTDVIKMYPSAFSDTAVIGGTFTTRDKKMAGKRFVNRRTSMVSGAFYDTLIGLSSKKGVMIYNAQLRGNANVSVVAHEYAHKLNDLFDRNEKIHQKYLFDKAKDEGKFMRDYAKSNEREYFAVGMEAYVKPYVPHNMLLDSNYKSRYTLMEKDPELYNFIERVLDKYSNPKIKQERLKNALERYN